MIMLRIFIKPDGRNWLNLPLTEGQTPAVVWGAASREGVIIGPDFFVPMDSVHFAATWTVVPAQTTKPTVVPFSSPFTLPKDPIA